MDLTRFGEEHPFDKFVDAVVCLMDITTIHTDPNLASMKASLRRGGSDGPVSDDMVRALEVLGIARAVATRFRNTPQHNAQASSAVIDAALILSDIEWSTRQDTSAGMPALGESDNGYCAFLLTCFNWIHKCGTIRDNASADENTCLCPLTAYLQLILNQTPMEDWAEAAADPDGSPLGFAWAWERRSPDIGSRTANVIALVTMGCRIHRLMVNESVRAERVRRSTAAKNRTGILTEGVSAALMGTVKGYFMKAATGSQDSPCVPKPDEASELRTIATEKLRKEGERYAQLLGEKDVDQECERVVGSIRFLAEFILGRAEPPAPEKLLLVVARLAMG